MALFGKKKKNDVTEEANSQAVAEEKKEESTLDLIKETMEEAKEERNARAEQPAPVQENQAADMPTPEEIKKAQEILARARAASEPNSAQIPAGAKVGVNAKVNTAEIKAAIEKFVNDKSQENLKNVMDCLQKKETLVCVPAQIITSKENQEKMKQGGEIKLDGPVRINPVLLTDNNGKKVFPIFSGEDTIPEDLSKKTPKVNMPLAQCLNIMKGMNDVESFALDPFTANIRIGVEIKPKQ